MSIQKREVDYAKEVDDVGVALESILADIRAKKPIMEIAANSLPKLVTAIDGIDKIGDEAKLNRLAFIQTLGYRLGGVVDALLPKA